MITLQDAIERAKLAADESGMVSNYVYDQVVDQLSEDDKYAFTMALVDLGIHTKLGSLATRAAMIKIISKDFYDQEEEVEEDPEEDIADEFVKISQAFRKQTPSGLWVPDSYEPGDEKVQSEPQKSSDPEPYSKVDEGDSYFDTEEDYQSFAESYPYTETSVDYSPEEVSEGESELEPEEKVEKEPGPEEKVVEDPEDDFEDAPPEAIIELLEETGIHVDKDGLVTLYKQNIPGLYIDKVTSNRPIPIEDSINQLNSYANAIDKEQQRISNLQDLVTVISKDLEAIDQGARLKDYTPKFQDIYNQLGKFKYSEKSPDSWISSIAQGISALKQYMNPETSNVRKVKQDVLQVKSVVRSLKTELDKYYQTQYDKYDEKLEALDALERLKDIKDSDPKAFQSAVRGMGGGVMASLFIQAQMSSYWDEHETTPVYGSLEIEIGSDYLKNFFESKMPGEGEQLLKDYLEAGSLEPNSEEGYDLRNDLEGDLEIGTPEGEQEVGTEFKVIQGNGVSGIRGLWFYDEGDPSVGMGGGWMIDDHEELSSAELDMVRVALDEDLQRFVDLYAKGEFRYGT